MLNSEIKVVFFLGVACSTLSSAMDAGGNGSHDGQEDEADHSNETSEHAEFFLQDDLSLPSQPPQIFLPHFESIEDALHYPTYSPTHLNDYQMMLSYLNTHVDTQNEINQTPNEDQQNALPNYDYRNSEQFDDYQTDLEIENYRRENLGSIQHDVSERDTIDEDLGVPSSTYAKTSTEYAAPLDQGTSTSLPEYIMYQLSEMPDQGTSTFLPDYIMYQPSEVSDSNETGLRNEHYQGINYGSAQHDEPLPVQYTAAQQLTHDDEGRPINHEMPYSTYATTSREYETPLVRETHSPFYDETFSFNGVQFQLEHGTTPLPYEPIFNEYVAPVEQETHFPSFGETSSELNAPFNTEAPPQEITNTLPSGSQHAGGPSNLGQSSRGPNDTDRYRMNIGDYNHKFIFNPDKMRKKKSTCYLRVSDLPLNHGIFSDEEQQKIIHPTYYDHLKISDQSVIRATCPNIRYVNEVDLDFSYFKLINHDQPGQYKWQSIELKCDKGKLLFAYDNRELANHEYECNTEQIPVLKGSGSVSAALCPGLQSFISGFVLKIHVVKILLEFCAIQGDNDEMDVKYVISTLNKDLKGQETFGQTAGPNYSEFLNPESSIFHDPTKNLYRWDVVKYNLIAQLGEIKYGELIQGREDKFFIVPGFLGGKYDNVYRMEQMAAYHPANLKPQWSNLQRNWNVVEIALTWLATEKRGALTVYSGTEGIQKHLNYLEKSVDIFIGFDSGAFYHPVPDKFWKIVQHSDGACIVIVGHNTPYDVQEKDKVCHDVTNRVSWLRNLQTGEEYGTVYTCDCEHTGWIEYMPPLKISDSNKHKTRKFGQPLLV